MYIQLNPDNETVLRTINTSGNVSFSADVFQPVHTLTPDQMAIFRVHPLVQVEQPLYDPVTHSMRDAQPVKSDGVWKQAWEVFPLPDEVVAENRAAAARSKRDRAKLRRQELVDAIKVTTQAGNTFDGDEVSQTRMARAVIALQATGTPAVTWVLADNTPIQATAAELSEALTLAGAAQAAVWLIQDDVEGEQA